MKKPLILVSNDDSIHSKGIKVLVEQMVIAGAEVVVVAPENHQSGQGHAITLGSPIRVRKSKLFGEGVEAYECTGTPADCVKVGKHLILKGRKIDLIVSGINHGSNASIAVVYSGTMSAAIEGAIEGIPSIGFSLCDFDPYADFSHTYDSIQHIINYALTQGIPSGIALNVNFPHVSNAPLKGIKVCRQSGSYFKELFEERKDPYQRPYYWLDGNFVASDTAQDTDEWALEHGYVSIVPCKCDLTDYPSIEKLEGIQA
jgi:5'-nucleotidase